MEGHQQVTGSPSALLSWTGTCSGEFLLLFGLSLSTILMRRLKESNSMKMPRETEWKGLETRNYVGQNASGSGKGQCE